MKKDTDTNFLDIIIPRYREDEKLSYQAFSSINNQQLINFDNVGIIVINDGKGISLDVKFFEQFENIKDNIDYYVCENNLGPGMARQLGLDKSKAKYVMFMDQDDMLYSNMSIFDCCTAIYSTLQKGKENAGAIYHFGWYETIKGIPLEHKANSTWLHGVIFDRHFLVDNKIKFNDKLRLCEDTYFMSLARDVAVKLDVPIYSYSRYKLAIWRDNPNSTVRKQFSTAIVAADYMISSALLFRELIKRDIDYSRMIVYRLFYGIIEYDTYIRTPDYKKDDAEALKYELTQYLLEFKDDYDKINKIVVKEVFEKQVKTIYGKALPVITKDVYDVKNLRYQNIENRIKYFMEQSQ